MRYGIRIRIVRGGYLQYTGSVETGLHMTPLVCDVCDINSLLTFAPSLSKCSAILAPIPEDAPVRTTTLSFKRCTIIELDTTQAGSVGGVGVCLV